MVSLSCATKRYNFSQIFYRSFCVGISKDPNENNISTGAKKSFKQKHAAEVYDYLKNYNAEHLFKKIPSYFLEKRKCWKTILINPLIAKRIGVALKLHLNEAHVLESDPGFGLISKELLEFVTNLSLYEEDIHLRLNLRKLEKKYQKVEIFDRSLLKIHKIQWNDHLYNDIQMNLLFDKIPADKTVNILVTLPNKIFISGWIRHLLSKEYFSKFDNLEFYFLLSPSIYTRLTATPHNEYSSRYQPFSVLAQLLFNIELILNDIPRKAFLPWPPRKNLKHSHIDVQKYENDYEVLFLVRMCLQKNFLKNFREDDLFRCFVHFSNEVARGQKRIIPYFEKLIPGSGVRLIVKGFTIYSYFGELTPLEIFSLFMEFTKWPEFKSTSLFKHWENVGSRTDSESIPPIEDICDEDDNDDEMFIPGNKVK